MSRQTTLEGFDSLDHTYFGADKIKHFKWEMKDSPGCFALVSKKLLKIDKEYQRELSVERAVMFASTWSWVACGVIIVVKRKDDSFFVVDGQHRVAAAHRRSDIHRLPCLVFDVEDIEEEAQAFLDINLSRKVPPAIVRYRAGLVAKHEDSERTARVVEATGVLLRPPGSRPSHARETTAVAAIMGLVAADEERTVRVLSFLVSLSDEEDRPIPNNVLRGLWYLDAAVAPLSDRAFGARLRKIGLGQLDLACRKATGLYGKGGAKVWARGMLDEVNKGLRNRYTLDPSEEADQASIRS